MGPWGHRVNEGRALGELDFGHGSVVDLEAAMTGFLDEMVRGRPPVDPESAGSGVLDGRQRMAKPLRMAPAR